MNMKLKNRLLKQKELVRLIDLHKKILADGGLILNDKYYAKRLGMTAMSFVNMKAYKNISYSTVLDWRIKFMKRWVDKAEKGILEL